MVGPSSKSERRGPLSCSLLRAPEGSFWSIRGALSHGAARSRIRDRRTVLTPVGCGSWCLQFSPQRSHLEASECPRIGHAERGSSSWRENPRTKRCLQTRGEGPAAEQPGWWAAARVPEEPVCPRSPCAHAAHVPEEPVCPWSPCAHGARVPEEPVCPCSPCAHGARVPEEPVCPWSLCAHAARVPEKPVCPWSPCAYGARVSEEPMCPWSPWAHGARVPKEPVCPWSLWLSNV